MLQGIQPGPQMLVQRTLVSCSPSNQRSAIPLPVPDAQGHLWWDLTLAGIRHCERKRLICSEEKPQWTELRAGGPVHSPIASPPHGQGFLSYRPPPCAQLGHPHPSPGIPSAILKQWSKSELKVQGLCWPPAGLRKAFLWCTMTEPFVKEAQTWTRIPPHWALYIMEWKCHEHGSVCQTFSSYSKAMEQGMW